MPLQNTAKVSCTAGIGVNLASGRALSGYRHGWLSMEELKSTIGELLVAPHRDTGEYEIPRGAPH